ncbi:MAG: hypothetical protein IKU17_00705 [Clostridia bacterium]|nr:hypothetical protein [Clostridia bacterium]
MDGVIVACLVGMVCIALGISNMKGNISSLHSYHRSRVTEEDRLSFGRLVGLGTIIIGGVLVIYGLLMGAALYTHVQAFTLAGTIVLIAGLVVGLGLSFYAMLRYNKGIF